MLRRLDRPERLYLRARMLLAQASARTSRDVASIVRLRDDALELAVGFTGAEPITDAVPRELRALADAHRVAVRQEPLPVSAVDTASGCAIELDAGPTDGRPLEPSAPAVDPAVVPGPPAAPRKINSGTMVSSNVGGRRAHGTLGWSFQRTDGGYAFLSNWHVLCAGQNTAPRGPGGVSFQERARGPAIGHLMDFVPVWSNRDTRWDLAVGAFAPDVVPAAAFENGGPAVDYPTEVEAIPSMGSTYGLYGWSGYHEFTLVGVMTLPAPPSFGARVRMLQQLLFEPREGHTNVKDGDSGAVFIRRSTAAVSALSFGRVKVGGEERSVGNPLGQLGLVHRGIDRATGLGVFALPCFET